MVVQPGLCQTLDGNPEGRFSPDAYTHKKDSTETEIKTSNRTNHSITTTLEQPVINYKGGGGGGGGLNRFDGPNLTLSF